MGRRTPDYTVAQHRFRFGFILLVPQGAADASLADSVQQVETYRQQFVAAYAKFSANLAAADTTLNRSLRLSLFPAAGVVAGGSATATISVQTPPKTDLVRALDGARRFCASAARRSPLPPAPPARLSPSRESRPEWRNCWPLPPTPSYETAFARVQVAAPSQLTLRTMRSAIPLPGNVRGALDRRQRTAVPRGAHCGGSHQRQRDARHRHCRCGGLCQFPMDARRRGGQPAQTLRGGRARRRADVERGQRACR